MKKRNILKNFKWRKLIVVLCVFTILTFLPIIIYLHFAKTIQTVAFTVTDNFTDTTLIDEANSSNYVISGGNVSVQNISYNFGTGNDGACTVSSNRDINTTSCVGKATADAVRFRVTSNVSAGSTSVTLASTPTGLAIGDEILIINLQGTTSDSGNVGKYDTAYITGINSNTLSLDTGLTNGYNGTTQKIMVQRIPNYTNVTVNAGVNWYPSAWNGTTGGVLLFRASGTVTVNGTIHANTRGYRGGKNIGAAPTYRSRPGGEGGEAFCGLGGAGGSNVSGNGGSGAAGGGAYLVYSGGTGYCGGGGGSGLGQALGQGSATSGGAGAGGAGGSGGGGGAGYGTAGGRGSHDWGNGIQATSGGTNTSGNGGAGAVNYSGGAGGGGGTYGTADLSKLMFGSGGGRGGQETGTVTSGYGGDGGGIVAIWANQITVSGAIQSSGQNGGPGWRCCDGYHAVGGGGGAGGSVLVVGNSITLGADKVTAARGTGTPWPDVGHPGGNGGYGRIAVKYTTSVSGSTSPAANTQSLSTYETTSVIQSQNLIPDAVLSEIQSFSYTLSSKPSGTSASIQFSTDALTWYNSSGAEGGSDTLTVGSNTIDLSSLSWETTTFQYKITLGTDGSNTPILDTVSLAYDSAPEIPTIGTPEALGTNSIRWNFTDNATNETGFKLLDGEDNVVKVCEGENLTYCDETELLENTQYTRKILAYNDLGESDPSASASAYTLVSAPTMLPSATKTTSTITLLSDGQVNGSEMYFDCDGSGCDTGINEWIPITTDQVTGLNFNTPYNFRVKARNGDDVETVYSSSITIYTLTQTPSISPTPTSSTSVSLEATNVNNITDGSSAIYFECEEEVCNTGIKQWIQTETDTVSNLSPNALYFFRVKARNFDSIETTPSDYVGVYTFAQVPQPPTFIAKETNSISISLTEDDNATGTQYLIQEENSGYYVDHLTGLLTESPTWGNRIQFGLEGGTTVSGLDVGVEYIFKVKAKNEDNIETEYSDVLTVSTKMIPPTLIESVETTATSFQYTVSDDNTSRVGYKIYDTDDNLLLECLEIDMDSCIEPDLEPNTTYTRKAKVYSSISESDFSETFEFTTHSQPSTISSIQATGVEGITVNINAGPNDRVQILETNTNKYLSSSLGVLTPTSSLLNVANKFDISGLTPNTKYDFKVRSLNTNNVATTWSSTQSTYTHARKPALVKVDNVSSSTVRVYINTFDNPSDTQILVRESNSSRYLDFTTNTLINTEKWGTISDFGSTNGILVNGLQVGTQYGFSTRAKNNLSVNTDWSEGIFVGTTAILLNVDSRLNTVLVDDVQKSVKTEGQYGEKRIRVQQGEYILADIPVLFSEDRDWSDAVILSSSTENKTVVKVDQKHGVLKPYTMYVVKGDTNAFILCPDAQTLEQVTQDCQGGVKYTGPYPQTKEVEGSTVSVSETILGGTQYWVADGLTGTGGQGYIEEDVVEQEDVVVEEEDDDEEQEEEQEVVVTSQPRQTPLQGIIEGTTKVINYVKDATLGIVDRTPVKDLNERELQQVTTTASVVTVTVGATAVVGGLTQLAYSVIQTILVILSALGFRKKRVSYGFVYDSNSKEPIHMALVRIYKGKKLVETAVTDTNGRFSGSLPKGKYKLEVSKSGYEFPSIYIKGTTDYPLQNVYNGDLEILSEDADIQIAVPVDPKEILGGKRSLYVVKNVFLKTLSILNIFIFLAGVTISIYTYTKFSSTNNLLLLLLYIIPFYVLVRSIFNRKGKYGKVVDEKGKHLSGISVTVKEAQFDKVVSKRVTNKKGKYRFIIDEGKYELGINEKDYELVDVQRGKLIDTRRNNYVLAKKIVVRKK